MNAIQKALFKTMAKKAYKEGVRALVIELKEDGDYDVNSMGESDEKIIVSRKTHEFLLDFYQENKSK